MKGSRTRHKHDLEFKMSQTCPTTAIDQQRGKFINNYEHLRYRCLIFANELVALEAQRAELEESLGQVRRWLMRIQAVHQDNFHLSGKFTYLEILPTNFASSRVHPRMKAFLRKLCETYASWFTRKKAELKPVKARVDQSLALPNDILLLERQLSEIRTKQRITRQAYAVERLTWQNKHQESMQTNSLLHLELQQAQMESRRKVEDKETLEGILRKLKHEVAAQEYQQNNTKQQLNMERAADLVHVQRNRVQCIERVTRKSIREAERREYEGLRLKKRMMSLGKVVCVK